MSNSPFPFVALPDAALWQRIGSHAKCLYAALLSYRNRRSGLCNPKLATLAERLGKSIHTIQRALYQLIRTKMVIVKRTLFGNRYILTSPDQWLRDISATECDAKCGTSAYATDGMTHMPPVAPVEPDLYEPYRNEPDAAADCLSTPGKIAAAKTAAAAAGGVSQKLLNPKTESGDFPQNFPKGKKPWGAAPEAEALVAELMAMHPEPGNAPKAVVEAGKLLADAPETAPATIESLRASHAAWRARWAEYAPGRFIPQLWRWIAEGDWRNSPVDRKGAKSESWEERRKRESAEHDEQTYRRYAELGMWDILREYGGPQAVEVWRAKIEAEETAVA